jgi:peroxiredoxin
MPEIVRMRKVTALLFVWGILLAGPWENVFGQVATFSPQDPKIGEVVHVTYNPGAPKATILKPVTLTLQVLILPATGVTPVLLELPMEKTETSWKVDFNLDRSDARFLMYQFISGDLKDDNTEQGWSGLVLGADGKELEGARYWRGIVLGFGGYQGFRHRKDVAAAKEDVAKERRMYPDNYSAVNIAWYLDSNPAPTEASIARVKKEIDGVLARFRKNEDALPMILAWMDQTGLHVKADSLRTILISENPKGKVASVSRMKDISLEKDPLKRTNLLEEYVSEYPLKDEELLATQRQLLMGFVQTAQYEKGYTLLRSAPKLDASLYRSLTSVMIETGIKMDKAVSWLADGIEIIRKNDESSRPPYVTSADWKKGQANTLAGLLTIRGIGLSKLGRNPEAEPLLKEAYEMKNGEDLTINEALINAYVANGKFKEAEKLGLVCIRKAKSNLKIVEKFRTAYKSVHGSLDGYDKTVKAAKLEEETSLLKNGLNKPAPDFTLRDLNGATVKLSDLRGKVVVLDFWATWCAPCKASLPHLQKVFERYESYKTVAFIAMNTSERMAGPQREAAVKKFMADLKLTMPVVYDNGYTTAQQFGVQGIPTRYVIDKAGKIQFSDVGFREGDDMVNETITQIEVLLKH